MNQNRGSELGTWACIKAYQSLQMNNGTPQDQVQWHNLDMLDFVSGAHGPAYMHSNFGKLLIWLPMNRHSGTIYKYWIWSVGHMGQQNGK